MTAQTLFIIIIAIIVVDFFSEKIIEALNAKQYRNSLPNEVSDVYDSDAYEKSQNYKITNYKFRLWSSVISFFVTLSFIVLDGFQYVDLFARSYTQQPIVMALIFFGIIGLASSLIGLPFSYYKTFVIEEKFGFNKTSQKTFFLDFLKGLLMGGILGGGLMAFLIWLYQSTTSNFWWLAWLVVTIFTVFMNLFYSRIIVPLFNKQTPLKESTLKQKIANYANSVGFNLSKIFVINGSKRSTKANAYFSGFGREKRVTLYDTLINDLEDEEIVAVLAHEVGHYKKHHIVFNLITSIILTGITFFILSIFISHPLLSQAVGVQTPSFYVGLVTFGLIYAPISQMTGLVINYISRKFEYQADDYAKNTYKAEPLVSALKKLSKNSLSNLTPHQAYVFVYYSHPPLFKRIRNLMS